MLAYIALAAACVSMVTGSGPCAPHEDLLKMLQQAHNAPSYNHLSADNKALIPELISEAQSCQLTEYLYTVGIYKVLDLLDSMQFIQIHLIKP